ncbi:hypothetical protein K438DRAFT_1789015 [Mycena galopus ATCC 62051]|nr:hypothetical protein K438DRAFT_1789015 [Mycena galopus ATCC 62051]
MVEVQGYAGIVKSEKDRPGGESEVDFTRRKFAGTMSVIVCRVRHGKPEPERTGEFGFGSDQGRNKLDKPDKPDEPRKPDELGVISYLGYCIRSPEIWKKAGRWWIISPGKNRKRMESSANAGVDRKFMRRNGASPRTWPEWKRIKAGGEWRLTDDSGVPTGCETDTSGTRKSVGHRTGSWNNMPEVPEGSRCGEFPPYPLRQMSQRRFSERK